MIFYSTILVIVRRISFVPLLCLLAVGFVPNLMAQDAENLSIQDLDNLTFEQLLDLDVLQVASRKPLAKKEIPGTVTLIKRDEITRSGARDLIDVLRLVPGFEFGQDVNGVTGMGTRGLWGFEGKILFLVDGLQMNEILYGNAPLGNNFRLILLSGLRLYAVPVRRFMAVMPNLLLSTSSRAKAKT